jgi:replicative DNA helicase Mcm
MASDEFDKMSVDDKGAMHEALEDGCYDGETEILTLDGWKYFKDLSPDVMVASLNPEGKLEYVKPYRHVAFHHEGKMYSVSNRGVNLCVTPNHNMYISQSKGAGRWTDYSLIRMDQIPDGKYIRFKKNALWEGEYREFFQLPSVIKYGNQNCPGKELSPVAIPMKKWLRFLGIFLSEGSIKYVDEIPYTVVISQMKVQNLPAIEEIITDMGYPIKRSAHNYYIHDKQLATYCNQFGTQPHRYVPAEIKSLDSENLKVLFDSLMLGDGSDRHNAGRSGKGNQKTYVTSSKLLADDVQEIVLKIGLSGNIYKRNTAGNTGIIEGKIVTFNNDTYEVSVFSNRSCNPSVNSRGREQISTYDYSDMVYCVEVPNHILYVRRRGKPVWCGNTVSVAKAGIVATLQARCSVLAAANPDKGRFDDFVGVGEQIKLPPALLSRFDLIFTMADKADSVKDEGIADHILMVHTLCSMVEAGCPIDDDELSQISPPITPDMFRKYVAYAKQIPPPILTPGAAKVIKTYYTDLRAKAARQNKAVPVTARQMEGMIRLAESSAKIRLSPYVEEEDAERSVQTIDGCLKGIAYDPETGDIDWDKMAGSRSSSKREKQRSAGNIVKALCQDNGSTTEDAYYSEMAISGFKREVAEELLEGLHKECLITQNKGKIRYMG